MSQKHLPPNTIIVIQHFRCCRLIKCIFNRILQRRIIIFCQVIIIQHRRYYPFFIFCHIVLIFHHIPCSLHGNIKPRNSCLPPGATFKAGSIIRIHTTRKNKMGTPKENKICFRYLLLHTTYTHIITTAKYTPWFLVSSKSSTIMDNKYQFLFFTSPLVSSECPISNNRIVNIRHTRWKYTILHHTYRIQWKKPGKMPQNIDRN